jgi:hypothetical protein
MLAAMRLASSRVGSTSPSRRHKTIRLDQVHLPGNSELPLDQDARRSTAVTCTGVQTAPRAAAMPRAYYHELRRSKLHLFRRPLTAASRRYAVGLERAGDFRGITGIAMGDICHVVALFP